MVILNLVQPSKWALEEGKVLDSRRVRMLAIQTGIKRIHISLDAPRLTKLFLHAPKCVELKFSNGSAFKLSAEFLRVHSPAVNGKLSTIGGDIWLALCGNHICRTSGELWGKDNIR